jgi:GT2 family glycosyltransferase
MPSSPRACEVIKGACLVLRAELLEGGKVFDDRFVMYSEEVDLCRRLMNRGLQNVFFPGVRVLHYGERSARREDANAYSVWHYHRSRLLYFAIHGSAAQEALVWGVLLFSLIQKALILTIMGKWESAGAHAATLVKILRFGRGPIPLPPGSMAQTRGTAG